ncbi:M64 family metallopeptidase [Actinophytocola xanthii]|uniref:Peptidase n=1 Tax=Actinophytocola xanthii TaxID=1912961 RepID=A0A1Q8CSY8_9PSEU|nr:M64 family metallopeptidase [Actinophytocola xanthii]OLF17444.1 peptidase [Actinophytocola xanthii]
MRRTAVVAAAVVAATTAGLPATAWAATGDARVVPVQVTGDPAQRFNLVFLGDGYTAAELPEFRANVDKHLNVLWTLEPFKSYRSYLNVYAVEIESAESGVDCDPGLDAPSRNTPLDMGFWGGCDPSSVQRLLTVDGTAANRYADLVPGTSPANRQLLALGNSDTYGGAGGTNATASGGNALSALITPHELGHSLGGLDDEYDYYQRGVHGLPYTGGEPDSVHHTLLTRAQMISQRRKWWRWLGERSESGGVIGRHEGGLYSGSGVWKPSAHSMMRSLGYYFDQVSRERMTERISAKTRILQDSTPTAEPIGADRVVWVETMYPVSHQLDLTWTLDGRRLRTRARALDLSTLDIPPGVHRLRATVVDPTPFVRDPAVRSSAALTQSRTWTVDTAVTTPLEQAPAAFTLSTPTTDPVGATDVVYVETTHPTDRRHRVRWVLDGRPLRPSGNDRAVDLEPLRLTGSHTLTAATGGHTLSWRIDASVPDTSYSLSEPLLRRGREHIVNGPFTMALTGVDDTPGYLVREFRTDGDGWYNYFGWPTDPDAPFLFTPSGTNIDDLVYGKLGRPRLSPWDDPTPDYGRHTIEHRAIDPSGNIGPAEEFAVTLIPPPPTCTRTVSGRVAGPLVLVNGVTCLDRATVTGPVTVRRGAGLVATRSTVSGPLTATGADAVELLNSTVVGRLTVTATRRDVTFVGGTVHGPVVLSGNRTGERAPVLAGLAVRGPLACVGNAPAPVDLEVSNEVTGPTAGQCANF